MSIKRLTADERATYLIGQAIRTVLTSPDVFTEAEYALAWTAYGKLVPAVLTGDEVDSVMTTTGLVGEGWLEGDAPQTPADAPLSATPDLRASYLIGNGLRRVMLDQQAPAELRAQAWAGYSAACDHGMTPAEAVEVRQTTSLIDLSGQWEEGARDSSDEGIDWNRS